MILGARTAAWAKSGAPLPYLRRVAYLRSDEKQYASFSVKDTGTLMCSVSFILERVYHYTGSWEHAIAGACSSGLYFDGWKIVDIDDNVLWESPVLGVEKTLSFINKSFNRENEFMYLFSSADNDTSGSVPYGRSELSILQFRAGQIFNLIPVLDMNGRPCFYNEAPLDIPADDPSRFFYNKGSGEFGWKELDGTIVPPQ